MPPRRRRPVWSRLLVVLPMLIGMGRLPLPRAEYHNVRHHDGPGQVCELHEHLLRWHPGVGPREDVALLHWHWLPPRSGGPDDTDDEDGPSAAFRAVAPADLPADDEATAWRPEVRSTSPDRSPAPTPSFLAAGPGFSGDAAPPRDGPPGLARPPHAPRPAPLPVLLSRWTC